MSLIPRFRMATLGLVVTGLAAGLAACGDQDKATAAPAPVAAAPAPAAAPAATSTPAAAPAATPAPAAAPAPAATAATKPVHHHREHRPDTTLASAAPSAPACRNCGVVTGVRDVVDPGQASGAGAFGGAVAGGVLGHQTGRGRGRDAMTLLGAIGGAVAGNYAEKQMRKSHHYEVSVHFNDGSSQTFRFQQQPPVQVGDHVREDGGTLSPQ